MRIDAPIFTGSFSLNGSTLGSLTSVATTGSNTFLGGQSATSFAGDQLTANDRAYLRRIDGIAGTTIEVIAPISASAGITGSTNFDTIVNKPTLVSGSSQVIDILSSLNSATASFTPRISNLESKSSSVDISISNINSVTASNIARLNNLETKSASVDISISNINSYTSSQDTKNTTLGSYTGSNDTKWTSIGNLTGSYATTGSNTFFGTQTYSGSVYIANDLIVQGSSSIQYISASSVSIGTNIVQLNTANPSVRFAGLTVIDSGSIGGSGSFLYDSVHDEFIFVHRGNGTNVTSSHFVLGPETYDSLGNETYLTCNVLTKGTGKEHLIDSCIFDNGTTTCIKNNLVGTGAATFSNLITVSGFGTSNFSSGGTGYNKLVLRNTTAGVANGAQLSVGTDADADQLYILSFATTYTTSGMNIAGGAVINGEGPGGLSIAATQSNIGFYTNGSTAANERMRITCAGNVGIGTCTPTDKLQILGSLRWGSASNYLVSSNDGGGVYMELAGTTTATRVLRIQGINNAANSYSSIRLEAGISEIAFTTIDLERMRITSTGITCFACQVCAPTFAANTVRGSGNLDLNGNSGYLTLRTGDVTRLYVGSTGGVSVGAVTDPGVNNFIVAGTICSAGQVKGSSLFAGGPACGSGWRLGGSTYNTAYEGDGLWGTNSTPNFIQSPVGYGIRIGYTDNGSGLYGAAYGFDVSYKDGLNNCIDYNAIIMRNSGQGTTPFRVTSYGNIYGTSKNFRIKHPIPSMNDTHYLIHTSIEGPQADLIYRGKVQLVNGKAEVNIDLASRMTDGTFEALCQDVQSYTTNESGWSLTKSYVVENILHIEAQDETSDDTISWLVIGERNDDGIKNSAVTDENGHIIVEELKPEEGL